MVLVGSSEYKPKDRAARPGTRHSNHELNLKSAHTHRHTHTCSLRSLPVVICFFCPFSSSFPSFVFDHITLLSNSNISNKPSKNFSLLYRQQCFLSQLKRRTSRNNPGSQGFYYYCYARQNERVKLVASTELCVHSSFHLFG